MNPFLPVVRRFAIGAIAAGAATVLALGVASAAAPIVLITSPTDGATLTYPSTVNVTGTVTHIEDATGANDNLCMVSNLRVKVTGPNNYEQQIGHTQQLGNPPSCSATSTPWSFPWTVPATGNYSIVATAKVSNETGQDDIQVIVQQLVTAENPAAPAVANDLLKGSSIKGKQHGKCIAAVADHMGSSPTDQSATDFSGKSKDDVAAYAGEVTTFLGTPVCNGSA
jgi:hypothetical protein